VGGGFRLLEPPYELAKEFFPVALAACFVSNLGSDHRHDANDLCLRGKPIWI
jgi:hypothetical protein